MWFGQAQSERTRLRYNTDGVIFALLFQLLHVTPAQQLHPPLIRALKADPSADPSCACVFTRARVRDCVRMSLVALSLAVPSALRIYPVLFWAVGAADRESAGEGQVREGPRRQGCGRRRAQDGELSPV